MISHESKIYIKTTTLDEIYIFFSFEVILVPKSSIIFVLKLLQTEIL